MSGNALSVESSLGHMDVQFGWSDWVSITTPRSSQASFAARRLVPSEAELADLLASFGLPDPEADTLARELWRHRPHTEQVEEDEVAGAHERRLLLAACVVTFVLGLMLATGLLAGLS